MYSFSVLSREVEMKCQNGDCKHEASIALCDGRQVCPSCSLKLDDRPGRGVKAECHELNPHMSSDPRQAMGLPRKGRTFDGVAV